jgi:hypothetical protein
MILKALIVLALVQCIVGPPVDKKTAEAGEEMMIT